MKKNEEVCPLADDPSRLVGRLLLCYFIFFGVATPIAGKDHQRRREGEPVLAKHRERSAHPRYHRRHLGVVQQRNQLLLRSIERCLFSMLHLCQLPQALFTEAVAKPIEVPKKRGRPRLLLDTRLSRRATGSKTHMILMKMSAMVSVGTDCPRHSRHCCRNLPYQRQRSDAQRGRRRLLRALT